MLLLLMLMGGFVTLSRRLYELAIEERMAAQRITTTSNTSPSLTGSRGLTEYQVEIEPGYFISAVHDFLRQHAYRLRPSAPAVLERHWWEVADEDLATREIYLLLRYDEHVDALNDSVPFYLRMRLQLVKPGPVSYMQVGWSYDHKYVPAFKGEATLLSIPSKYAAKIVDYTIDELRLELLAAARARNPQLGASLARQQAERVDRNWKEVR
jgi:hypothetical protein